MDKIVYFLKKILKVFLWFVMSLIMLFIIIALLIQVPAIQTKIVHLATSYISNKTHTKVEIKNISISLPKSVVIEGLFLEDTQKDTLLYAGQLKANIAFSDLFHHEIHITSVALQDANLCLSRTETDSLFNFNFLLTAFSDTTKQIQATPEKKSQWAISVDNVSMKNIKFHFYDDYGGINAGVNLKELKLRMDKLDIANSIYAIDDLFVETLTASVLIKKSNAPQEKKSEGVLPEITAKKIHINNTIISYGDSVSKLSLTAGIIQLGLKDASVDLQKQSVALDNLSLSKSNIHFNSGDTQFPTDTVAVTTSNDWKITLNNINLDDNSLTYTVLDKPELKNSFDANHLNYNHLSLAAKGFYYSSAKTEISIKKFLAVDKNNFSVLQLETDFYMDVHSITAKNLKVKTNNSSVEAYLNIKYSSLKALQDSLPFLIVNADIKKVSIRNSDIIYFMPQLTRQTFFKNAMNTTTVSGIITGSVNNLKGKNLIIRTGINTFLKTDFLIVGLPAVETAYFNFPDLEINIGKKDIKMMVGSIIPDSIELPENIRTQISFKGQIKSFDAKLAMSSSFGNAYIFASIDKKENFKSKVNITNFDLGSLLRNKAMFGPVSLTAEANGHGLDKNTIMASLIVDISQISLNKYTYHKLTVDGNITGEAFEGKINLKDENASFEFDGLVNLNPSQEHYKFNLNLQGADLQKLNFTKDDMRIGLMATADLKGGTIDKINGKAAFTNIIIAHEEKKYILDSVLLASVNEPGKSELDLKSALINIKYTGNLSPVNLPNELSSFINNYFPFSDSAQQKDDNLPLNFNFEMQLHNHPMLSEVLLPQLKEFEPLLIQGSFDSRKNELKLNASSKKIVYGATEINDIAISLNSDVNTLNYKISSSTISNSQFKLDNLLIDGKLADQTLFAGLSSTDNLQNKKLLIRSRLVKEDDNYKLSLIPVGFYLMNNRWDIAADNYIEFGKQGFLIHHLFMNKGESQINIASVHDLFNDDLNMGIKKFNLNDISGIFEKDSSLVKGDVDGNVLLKRVKNTYGLIADAKISNLFVTGVPIGNLSVKADNPTTEKFNIDVNLSGADNNLTANGFYIPAGGDNSVNIKAAIQSLSLKTVKAFSMGAVTDASGNLTGNFLIGGKADDPDVTGELVFNNVSITPALLNNPLHFKNETILLKKEGIYFKTFTISDADNHTAIIDGNVRMTHFQDFIFALNVNTNDFLLFNTTAKDNKEYYGRMIIDSKIDINGPLTLPVINAKIKMKKGSNFTFAVPEEKLSADKGEDVVVFNDSLKLNPILFRDEKKTGQSNQESGLKGFDLSSTIEIDKQATFKLLLDPSSNDSLVVKGEAALSFTMDRSGKTSLTGTYNLNEGSYLVSLETVVKRKFDIDPGSTITWNGDPLDADITINAIYSVRTSPFDLVADQMTGLSDADKNQYKQRYPFLVLLKLRGAILHPEISFEIQLLPEDKGILGGAVNAKLTMLNENPSALNKQVFALLVLGRFIQENPLQSESSGGISTAVRTSVGKFLSAQLNQLSSKIVPGVELNFDVQSYDDYQTGQAEGRTQVEIGIKKQIFNERFTIQVGGTVDVEGEKAKQNSASDITSDVTVEYKITDDGRYRLKGFRHNQYEGAIEGQLVETGAGILFVKDFNKWKDIFKSLKNSSNPLRSSSDSFKSSSDSLKNTK